MDNYQLKNCVLKPIMWNNNNYSLPSGVKSTGGFSKDYGYGHEEWNNNANWNWKGFKVFHTESKPQLLDYSKSGNLGIVMIASNNLKQYAVGIGTNVFYNDEEDRDLIAHELNLFENYKQVWQQQTVRNSFKNNFEKFMQHWNKNYSWVQWKCPEINYHWFKDPIFLNPMEFNGKQKLITMHGSYQRVLPQVLLKVMHKQLKEKQLIINWLTEGEFDAEWLTDKSVLQTNSKLRKKYVLNGRNAPTTNSYSYWVEGQRNIDPLHAKLQAKYIKFLSKQGINNYIENQSYIDLQYTQNDRIWLCEIKPTEKIESKYAIRYAVGQLLEYQFHHNKTASLEVVLSTRPKNDEMDFIKSLNIRLAYFDCELNEFIIA